MSLSVNTNLASLAARGRLDAAGSALQTHVQRLSSGLRVNGARDDAAGLAIAERLNSQLRGLRQGVRNGGDALSLFAVADAALGAAGDRLQRARELLVQGANAGYSTSDRQAIDAELQQQLDEIDRVAAGTQFNGRALLDGSWGSGVFQIGAGSADTLSVTLDGSARCADLGAVATATSCDLRTLNDGSGGYPFAATVTTVALSDLDFSRPAVAFSGGWARTVGTPASNYSGAGAVQFTVDGQTVSLNADYGSLAGVASAVQSQLGSYGVSQDGTRLTITKSASAASPTSVPAIVAVSGAGAAVFAATTGSAGTTAQATSNAGFTVDGARVSLTADHSGSFDALAADIQAQLDAARPGTYRVGGSTSGLSISRIVGTTEPVLGGYTGTGATVFARSPRNGLTLKAGDLSVQLGDGRVMAVVGSFPTPAALAAGVRAQVGGDVATSINDATGRLEISATKTITLSGAAAGSGGTLAFTALVNEPTGSLDDVEALTADTARRSLLRVDAALASVNLQRAGFGALQRRFDAVVAGAQQAGDLAAAVRGRIVDADIATETAGLSRQRVLQQAAMAVLAQANTQPQMVLELLK